MISQAAPMGSKHRISSDDCWPLRRADGRTFADKSLPADPVAQPTNGGRESALGQETPDD